MGINRVEGAPFAQISNEALRDSRLSFRARGILAMVLSHSGEWHATREWIARQSGHEGRQAIQTALNELTAYGYRRVHKERGQGGAWVTVTSWFHHPNGELVQESTETAGELVQEPDRPETRPSGDPTVGQPVRHIEDHSKNTITEDHKEVEELQLLSSTVPVDAGRTRHTYPADFEDFWSIYPKKKAKGAAFNAYRKALKIISHQQLLDAVARFADDPNLPADKGFIPHASTWLNERRWDDEPYSPPTGEAGSISAYAALAAQLINDEQAALPTTHQRIGIAK